jgi:hypothetical protein
VSAAPIYVVVTTTGGAPRLDNQAGGPIVMETEAEGATIEQAQHQAARLERRFGACRVGRVVFEGEPGFEVTL